MPAYLWRLLRLGWAGGVLLLLAAPPLASAAPLAPASPASAGAAKVGANSSLLGSRWRAQIAPSLTQSGPHFLYVDDGIPLTNGISGYQITRRGLVPTPGGSPYPTGGSEGIGGLGVNALATSTVNGPCLFHAELQPGQDESQVESFSVNPATRALTEVSIVPLAGEDSTAGDVHVSADGREVYVTQFPLLFGSYYLDVLTVGSGCALTLATHFYPPNGYFTIALVGADGLLGVNTSGNTLDLYHICHGTKLTLVTSTPSQIMAPLGATSGLVGRQTYVFSGSGSTTLSAVEVHTVNGRGVLGSVPGSPAMDSSSRSGPWVFFDRVHEQIIESELDSNMLGIFGAQGGVLAFLSHTAVVGGTSPGPMAQLGTVLLVAIYGGVDACVLTAGAASCLFAVAQHTTNGLGILSIKRGKPGIWLLALVCVSSLMA